MKIFLDKINNSNGRPLTVARKWFGDSKLICRDKEAADLILFLTEGYVSNKKWSKAKEYHSGRQCVLYSEADYPNLAIRGLYPSVYKKLNGRQPFPYLVESHPFPLFSDIKSFDERSRELYFRGRCSTHRVRWSLKNKFPGNVFDTAEDKLGSLVSQDFPTRFHCEYCYLMSETQFSLCPRGFGASSHRLYESLAWGCVPVIISDNFIAPNVFGDWSDFSIKIKERDLRLIDDIINEYKTIGAEMSLKARAAWERYFSPEGLASSLENKMLELLRFPENSVAEMMGNLVDRYHLGAMIAEYRYPEDRNN